MKKIVNGIEVDCSPEEEAFILAERKKAKEEQTAFEAKLNDRKEKSDLVGDHLQFLTNLAGFLEIPPEQIRDWKPGDPTLKSILDGRYSL